MPPRDPTKIQLDFPQLTADLIAQLNLIGTVGLLDFAPTVLPVFIIGDRDLTVDAIPVVFTSPEIFSGFVSAPLVNVIVADTGQLPAGTYDIWCEIAYEGGGGANASIQLQHRDAANLANLAILADLPVRAAVASRDTRLPTMGYVLSANERLRVQLVLAGNSGAVTAVIAARLRTIP